MPYVYLLQVGQAEEDKTEKLLYCYRNWGHSGLVFLFNIQKEFVKDSFLTQQMLEDES